MTDQPWTLVIRRPAEPKFELGRVVGTPGAVDVMQRHNIDGGELLARHQQGDWGDLCTEDRQANEEALDEHDPSRIFSVYGEAGSDARLYLITEWDRSVTTILRPEDY